MARSLRDLVSTLQGNLAQHENCWGTDSFGRAFSKGYGDNFTTYNGNVDVVANNLDTTAGNIDTAVTSFQNQDDANARIL